MTYEKSCGAIIFNDKNEVLLIQQNSGNWGFPKGHMEKGETEVQTAIREIKEETNVDIEINENYRYEISYLQREDMTKTVVYFVAKEINSNEIKLQDIELQNYKWTNPEEVANTLTYDNITNLWIKCYNDIKKIKQ